MSLMDSSVDLTQLRKYKEPEDRPVNTAQTVM